MSQYDVFISHASEDKDAIVTPLARALSDYGIRVWYDEFELKLGDSLSRSIDKGLAESSFGVVVLSPSFFAKNWPEYELRGLTAKEMRGVKVIIPVWHNVTVDDVIKYSPPLADKLGISTAKKSPEQIAQDIIVVIKPEVLTRIHKRIANQTLRKTAKTELVSLAKIKVGRPKHEELPPALISRIRLIRAALLGVYTHSMKFWVDGFRGDAHPSEQISWWEHLASCLREYAAMTQLESTEQYKIVFKVLLAIADGAQKENLQEKLKLLPEEALETLTDMWKSEYPAYDIDEQFPFRMEMSEEEHQKWVESLDIEDYNSIDKHLK